MTARRAVPAFVARRRFRPWLGALAFTALAACASAGERQNAAHATYDALFAACPETPVGARRYAGEIATDDTFNPKRYPTAIAYVLEDGQARGYFAYRDFRGEVCQPFTARVDRTTFRFRLPSTGEHGPAMITFRLRGDDTAYLAAERENPDARVSASGVLQQLL